MEYIKVVVKKVDEKPQEQKILNKLEEFQRIVDGRIDVMLFPNNVIMIINDEGKFTQAPNFELARNTLESVHLVDMVFGDVIFVGDQGEDFTSLTDDQIHTVFNSFGLFNKRYNIV